jgi:hypothetical protein
MKPLTIHHLRGRSLRTAVKDAANSRPNPSVPAIFDTFDIYLTGLATFVASDNVIASPVRSFIYTG